MAERRIRNIGLAFSGGGYRASAFHLGVLDMLSRLNLLDRVKGLSTVSGGTITGAYYVLARGRGKKPEEIIPALAQWLVKTDVIDRALRENPAKDRQAQTRRRTLICNATEVYDELLEGALFGELFDQSCHLEDVIFNATEFQYGLDFRFQKTDNRGARIGNGKVWISKDAARQLRLADIVGASSDFPAGFEPLEFPGDFVFHGPPPEMPKIPPRMAIMDGGIYDNQGSEALLLNRKDREEYDAVIVSDTDQRPKEAFFSMPKQAKSRGPEMGLIVTLISLLGIATVASALHTVWTLLRSGQSWWEIAIDLLPSVVAGGFFIAGFVGWRMAEKAITKTFPNLAGDIRRYLYGLRWADFVDFISLRARSLVTLTANIFLRRIRQLGYDRLDEDPKLKPKLVRNLIYAMATKEGKAELMPTPAQVALAERANTMPTTLWFTSADQFRDVFAAGQNTVVHALLRWMERGKAEANEEDSVTQRLRDMWQSLQEDPFRFVPAVPGMTPAPAVLPVATQPAAPAEPQVKTPAA